MNKLQRSVVITFVHLSKLAFMVIVLMATGCASKPLNITESYNAITLESENIDANVTYKLVDKAFNTTYTAQGKNGKVEFSLPATDKNMSPNRQSECLQLIPAIKTSAFGEPVERVQVYLPREYSKENQRYQQHLAQNQKSQNQYDRGVRAAQYTK
ncbi:MAG: hypothetical protein ACI8WB_005047 [Phenylobacterium sp.]|jgi:hypothetical protein